MKFTPPGKPIRRAKKRRPAEHANHERWLVSYADFITLMFAVFATLYAISTVDAQKLHSMVESTQQAFDPKAASPNSLLTGRQPELSKNAGPGGEVGLADLQKQITKRLAKEVAEHRVEIEKDGRGLIISIREAGSFSVGSADLTGAAQSLLLEIGSILTGIGNQVLIEGHTDDVPIHTARFASNWELSTTRATNVIAFLLDRTKVRPDHVSAAGYAEHHPKVANSSDANRTRNRRVDVIILGPTAAAEPTSNAGGSENVAGLSQVARASVPTLANER